MSAKDLILERLKNHPEGVSCRQFEEMKFGTYHKLASRISDLRKEGYQIVRRESHTESTMDAVYVLIDSPQDASNSNGKAISSQEPCLFGDGYAGEPKAQNEDITKLVGGW